MNRTMDKKAPFYPMIRDSDEYEFTYSLLVPIRNSNSYTENDFSFFVSQPTV